MEIAAPKANWELLLYLPQTLRAAEKGLDPKCFVVFLFFVFCSRPK